MKKETFAKDFSLRLKAMDSKTVDTFTEDEFFKPFTQRAVLGDNPLMMVSELHESIQGQNIINGIFDVELDFGEDRDILSRIDDSLLTAYVYTAYSKLFEEVIEPYVGKGNVYGVIYGGADENGVVTKPFLQLIFLTENNVVWDSEQNEWTESFTTWLQPLQQGIVDFMGVTYPEYVTNNEGWITMNTWEHQLNALPLVDETQLV